MQKAKHKARSRPDRRPALLGAALFISSAAWAIVHRTRKRNLPHEKELAPEDGDASREFGPQAAGERRPGHERSDVFVPGIVASLILTGVFAFMLHAGIWGWLQTLRGAPAVDSLSLHHHRGTSEARFTKSYPALQISPSKDWQSLEQEQRHLLASYTWVDRTAGIVRIPIEAAIDQMLKLGIPPWGTNQTISPLSLQRARVQEQGQ